MVHLVVLLVVHLVVYLVVHLDVVNVVVYRVAVPVSELVTHLEHQVRQCAVKKSAALNNFM